MYANAYLHTSSTQTIEKQVQRDKPWRENRFYTPYLDYKIGGVEPVFGPRLNSLYLFLYAYIPLNPDHTLTFVFAVHDFIACKQYTATVNTEFFFLFLYLINSAFRTFVELCFSYKFTVISIFLPFS